MKIELTPEQERARQEFREFAKNEVEPYAGEWDRTEELPRAVVQRLSEQKYLGSIIPQRWGGAGLDLISYGLLHEEIGRACSSLRSLITVHDMVATAILKWGSEKQKSTLLPQLASGSIIAGFAASEPDVGSEIAGIKTTATARNGSFALNGRKKWITGGQIADLFLVLARSDGKPTTFLLERNRANLAVKPIRGMLGTRASMLAELSFNDCPVSSDDILGRVGFGLLTAVSTGLGLGRYSVAWGCVGIAQACLDASLQYANSREQFGALLREHQLIQQLLSEMVTNVRAARLLCCHAGYLKQTGDPGAELQTFIAKYFASRAATRSATDAVQIHGAIGCTGAHSVERYFRDAKIMEIIEGSTQIQQMTIARQVYPAFLAELRQQAGATEPATASV